MRVALIAIVLAATTAYGAVAIYFWKHERSSQSISFARTLSPLDVKHPEATLGLIRDGLDQGNFSDSTGELIALSRRQVPAFYEAPAFEAVFHSGRLEAAAKTRESFESAIERFPASGRLHLDYARWLLMAPSRISGVAASPAEAEGHFRLALELEEALTREALQTLIRYGVPPERWVDIVPDLPRARRALVVALVEAGDKASALIHLRSLLHEDSEPGWKRRVAELAMSWGDPELALDAVRLWKAGSLGGFEAHEPGLLETRAQLRLGHLDVGYETFRRSLEEVGPATSAGLKLLCGVAEEYMRLQRYVLAESLFLEAAGYSPSYVRALLGLARVHVRLGNAESAVTYYERVLIAEPDHERAKAEFLSVMSKSR